MTDGAATNGERSRWWRFLFALFAFVALGYAPNAIAFLPVANAFVLVGAAAIACTVLAWALGTRMSPAPVLVALIGIAIFSGTGGAAPAYRDLVFGWAIILAASFGLVSLVSPTQAFLPRALTTLLVALLLGAIAAQMFGGGLERVTGVIYNEAARRADLLDLRSRQIFANEDWRSAEARQPMLGALRAAYDAWVHSLPARTVRLLPALLALQSLAALALGWTFFHKLSRARIGRPLAPLREFRFNDQFVWAIAVGLTILILPEFADGRAAGLNLLVFFGALFVLRGLGVVASLGRGYGLLAALIALTVITWPLGVAIAFALGLGDVWLDVRRRVRPKR